MNLTKLGKDPRAIRALTGMSYPHFTQLVPQFSNALYILQKQKQGRIRKPGGGRSGILKTPESKLFFILFYLKTYPTFDVLSFVTGKERSHCCEAAHMYLAALNKALGVVRVLPKRKITSVEELFEHFPEAKELLVDGFERRTQRSKNKKQADKRYSGKKKTHTTKAVVVADTKRRILVLTPARTGRRHDKNHLDKFQLLQHIPEDIALIGDTGFGGMQHQHTNTLLPHKATKKNPLTELQKEWNHLISSIRVRIEHVIGSMKRYNTVAHVYRNKKPFTDDLFHLLSAGLHNYGIVYA
jgi:hypothetical protein